MHELVMFVLQAALIIITAILALSLVFGAINLLLDFRLSEDICKWYDRKFRSQ
jgi:hypothetical protein